MVAFVWIHATRHHRSVLGPCGSSDCVSPIAQCAIAESRPHLSISIIFASSFHRSIICIFASISSYKPFHSPKPLNPSPLRLCFLPVHHHHLHSPPILQLHSGPLHLPSSLSKSRQCCFRVIPVSIDAPASHDPITDPNDRHLLIVSHALIMLMLM